jgi:transaldolase
VLRPAHETTAGVEGRVSIQVNPRIAHDTQRTVAEARALW